MSDSTHQPAEQHHQHRLAEAFDGQAAQFERAPVQSDPDALRRLAQFADFAADSRVLDAGCGPGLVAHALLEGGARVIGVDLSAEMIRRARQRCEAYGARAEFRHAALGELPREGVTPCDAAISRYVLHHAPDPDRFLHEQIRLVRPGGVIVLSDHTTDPRPEVAEPHQVVERLRDRTHTQNLAPGAIVDLFARVGLDSIRVIEEPFTLDFDEWFDRGTPDAPKAEVRRLVAALPPVRSFRVETRPDGGLSMHCWRLNIRGIVPG